MGDVVTKMADIAKKTMDTYHCDLISDGLFLGRIEERAKGGIDVIWAVRQTGTDITSLNEPEPSSEWKTSRTIADVITSRNDRFFRIKSIGSSSLRDCNIEEMSRKKAQKLIGNS